MSKIGGSWRTRGLLALAVIVASIAIYLLFHRGDANERIRGQLTRLTRAVEVDPGQPESPLGRIARIRGEFKELFVENVAIEIPELTALGSGRTALADAAAQAPMAYAAVKIDLASVRVTLVGEHSADVTAIATLSGTRAGGDPARDVRRVVFRFDEVDGDWRISRVQVAPRDEPS